MTNSQNKFNLMLLNITISKTNQTLIVDQKSKWKSKHKLWPLDARPQAALCFKIATVCHFNQVNGCTICWDNSFRELENKIREENLDISSGP
jgi:hypothetical protein